MIRHFSKKQLLWLSVSFLFVLVLHSIGCKKDELTSFSTNLAINSRVVRLADTASSTRIQVYSDNNWAVRTEADWIKLNKQNGSGKGEFMAEVTSNVGQLPRSAKIIINADSYSDTINLQQKGSVPLLAIPDSSVISIAKGGDLKVAINTNIPLESMTQKITYLNDDAWISALSIVEGYLNFKLTENANAQERRAKINLSYLDALGATVKDSLLVVQHPGQDFSNAVLKDFSYIKNSLQAGIINEDIYIEGIVVSDKGNPNMALNKNRTDNKHLLDKTENATTVYLQSTDGTSGLLLKTKTDGDNIFYRNERVKLALKGTKLTKAAAPVRVSIENIPSLNIIAKEAGAAVTPKEIYMKNLADNDLYTDVKLKDVELSVPFGSFSNIHEGYNQRTDCYVQNIRDINGSSMYMLTNMDVPYRRTGEQLPMGSGTISGILVSEVHPRYGGNIGKYSIRHIKRDDIHLQQNRQDGFSNVLVEWSRFKTEFVQNATNEQNPLSPDIGKGVLTQSEVPFNNFTSTGILGILDYNAVSTANSGQVTDGAWYARNWWNDAANRGGWWEIRVSTTGISKPISLQVEGQSNTGGPRSFEVEWSTTGNKNEAWNKIGEYTFQDLVSSSNTLLTQTSGMKAVNFEFPAAASNVPSLFIRLKVKNKTVGTATADTGGTLTASGASKLSHISIKYNK